MHDPAMPPHAPVVGICGYSGSGKTTLIEQLVPRLIEDGLSVAVVKHDAHGLTVDRHGKDTDRFYRAGAAVAAHDGQQVFLRRAIAPETPALGGLLDDLVRRYDIILVEGHKRTPLPVKCWLAREKGDAPPPAPRTAWHVAPRGEDRAAWVLALIRHTVEQAFRATPVMAGLLIGGASSRMGRPKHMLTCEGTTWAERIAAALAPHAEAVCLLGAGDLPPALAGLPRLPDVRDAAGPMAGLRAAMRWAPRHSWIFAPCDTPDITAPAIAWLLEQRAPGCRALLPVHRAGGLPQPLPGWYDFRCAEFLEKLAGPSALAGLPGVQSPVIPPIHRTAWRDIDGPDAIPGGAIL